MGRSNAAQEPSMEEILASIRKIIESGEEGAPVRAQPAPRLAAPVPTSIPSETAPEPVLRSQGEVEVLQHPDASAIANGTEIEAPDQSATEPLAEAADDFFDIDFSDLRIELEQELSEMVDSMPAKVETAVPLKTPEPVVGEEAPSVETVAQQAPSVATPGRIDPVVDIWPNRSDGRHAALRAAATVAVDRQNAAIPSRPAAAEAPRAATVEVAPMSSVSPQTLRPANSDDPRMNEFRAAIIEDAGRHPAPAGGSLLSDRSGGMVAASFDELTKAIRDGQLRSMETMAEDLMRPMLQEWLDDNLPKLVERLVREEIERVARGGR